MSKKINAGKNAENNATAKNEVVENEQTVINTELVENAPLPVPYMNLSAEDRFNKRFPAEQYAELHSECNNIFGIVPKIQEWSVHLSIDYMHFLKFCVVKSADFKRVAELREYSEMPNFEVFSNPDMETNQTVLRSQYLKLKKSIDSYKPSSDGTMEIVQEAFINKCSVQLKNTLHYTLLANTLPFFKQMNTLFKYKVYNIMQIARDWSLMQEYLLEKYASMPIAIEAIKKSNFKLCHALINNDAFNCNTSKRAVYIAQIQGGSLKQQEGESLFEYTKRYFAEKWKISNVSEMLLCAVENAVIGKVAAGNRNELLLLNC